MQTEKRDRGKVTGNMVRNAQNAGLASDDSAAAASRPHRTSKAASGGAKGTDTRANSRDTALSPKDSIHTTLVSQQIEMLRSALPPDSCVVFHRPKKAREVVTLKGLRPHLLELQLPKDGTVWTGGLAHWLRSRAVLQVLKLWVTECWQDSFVRSDLNKLLPLDQYPWTHQLKSIVELAKHGDLRKRSTNSKKDAKTLCAIYTRKLLLCTKETLIDNSPFGNDYQNYRLLDVPCAAILSVYYDLKTDWKQSFFGKLLESPLVLSMHSQFRKKIEKDYALDSSLSYAPEDPARFYTPSSTIFTMSSTSAESVAKIDCKVDNKAEPFNDKEKLGFWTAFRDLVQRGPTGVAMPEIDFDYILEVLPGRCIDEVKEFCRLNMARLKVDSIPGLPHSAATGKKRDAGLGDGNSGSSEGVKKPRITADGNADASREDNSGQDSRMPESLEKAAVSGGSRVAGDSRTNSSGPTTRTVGSGLRRDGSTHTTQSVQGSFVRDQLGAGVAPYQAGASSGHTSEPVKRAVSSTLDASGTPTDVQVSSPSHQARTTTNPSRKADNAARPSAQETQRRAKAASVANSKATKSTEKGKDEPGADIGDPSVPDGVNVAPSTMQESKTTPKAAEEKGETAEKRVKEHEAKSASLKKGSGQRA